MSYRVRSLVLLTAALVSATALAAEKPASRSNKAEKPAVKP